MIKCLNFIINQSQWQEKIMCANFAVRQYEKEKNTPMKQESMKEKFLQESYDLSVKIFLTNLAEIAERVNLNGTG